MSFQSVWFAEVDDEATDEFKWRPVLQYGETEFLSTNIWFRTESECEEFMKKNIARSIVEGR